MSEDEVREELEDTKIVTEKNLSRARQMLDDEGLHAASVELTEFYRYNSCRHVD